LSNEATAPPRVEILEEFKLHIAAIIRAKPEQIPAPPRPHPLLIRRKKRRIEKENIEPANE